MQEDLIVIDDNKPSGSGLGTTMEPASYRSRVGCIKLIALQLYDFKVLVRAKFWVVPTPALTRFMPRHNSRIEVTEDSPNPNGTDVQITPSQNFPSLASDHFCHRPPHLWIYHI